MWLLIILIIGIFYKFVFKDLVKSNEADSKKESEGMRNIYQLWVWRYGFSHYTTGRVWRLAVFARLQTEVRDRTVARTGPHSR